MSDSDIQCDKSAICPKALQMRCAERSRSVEVFKDRLRLAWSWQGKRFWLYVGLPDTRANRKVAEIKARTIELDITSNNFDPSLTKYKPQKQESTFVTKLFERFIEYKKRTIVQHNFTDSPKSVILP